MLLFYRVVVVVVVVVVAAAAAAVGSKGWTAGGPQLCVEGEKSTYRRRSYQWLIKRPGKRDGGKEGGWEMLRDTPARGVQLLNSASP
ncbi:hypothetical protein E2C01_025265 [Portunus trituberculatus]|uniref:Secreted protein n=1 Tax=Portunus trituberculatus TaxID=210409 RepID=A0A5B7EHE4_PORTR|nr:hypothetical protein [Portunus trituberculatus]